jgi:hypothetical protein
VSPKEYCPAGQGSHDVARENGFKLGCAMNFPVGQQSKRAVLEPLLLNALGVSDKDAHLLPHKVRVKPLL